MSIFLSVKRNLRRLLVTAGIFIIILYFFGDVGFLAFYDIFIYDDGDLDSPSVCFSVWACTISLLG
jgi:hypothetical protein